MSMIPAEVAAVPASMDALLVTIDAAVCAAVLPEAEPLSATPMNVEVPDVVPVTVNDSTLSSKGVVAPIVMPLLSASAIGVRPVFAVL